MEHWYALHTKPRKEFMVRENLENRGIRTFLPSITEPSKRSPAKKRELPFFARYLFARLDLETVPLSSINWSQGVTRVVSFGGQPAVVDDRVVRWLQARLAQMDPSNHLGGLPLTHGDRLRVTAGPLRGMEAIFDRRLSADDRARVLVQLLGQLTTTEIPMAWLEQLSE